VTFVTMMLPKTEVFWDGRLSLGKHN